MFKTYRMLKLGVLLIAFYAVIMLMVSSVENPIFCVCPAIGLAGVSGGVYYFYKLAVKHNREANSEESEE